MKSFLGDIYIFFSILLWMYPYFQLVKLNDKIKDVKNKREVYLNLHKLRGDILSKWRIKMINDKINNV